MSWGTLYYVQLVAYAAGTLVHLFILALLLAYRRRRAFERVLFFLVLSLFLGYSAWLLWANTSIHYSQPPYGTTLFASLLAWAGFAFLPGLLVWAHVQYGATYGMARWSAGTILLVTALMLPIPQALTGSLHNSASPVMLTPFLDPGAGPGQVFALRLMAALFCSIWFDWRFSGKGTAARERQLSRIMMVLWIAMVGVITSLYIFSALGNRFVEDAFFTTLLVLGCIPAAVLIYFMLRFNFLQMARQKNVVYAVSATFLALLYLAVVRRIGMWLEPVLPPEATASILLFVLVVLYEPLQRRVGRALGGAFKSQVDRLQRLMGEIQQEARAGELDHLREYAERRIREEFVLRSVHIRLSGTARETQSQSRGYEELPLWSGDEIVGQLEAEAEGAPISGEVHAALEFVAEQLPAALALSRAIEEKLHLERELAERERLALVGQMAASISHNLKNPLGSMKTLLQVQLESPELPESLRGDCALVVAEIDRLSAKLNQLLRYAKPPVRTGAAPQRVAAVALAEQMVTLLGHEAQRRAVRLGFEREPEETFVRGTEEALSDVLSNLLVNAIEVLPAGGNMQLRLARRKAALEIEVTDDGPGIPAEFRSKIFQPFFTTKPSGTGLGLAIVERRLAEMDGSIRWQSPVRDGRGTRFTVTLPVAE